MERGQAAVLVAPTMHGSMHTSILVENLDRLHRLGVRVIAPRDAYGKHNLPEEAVLVEETCIAVSALRTKAPRATNRTPRAS
jgi:phosphopantothenoylcysteine decarboxylase/phosphopantothenate--cysteine ligase